MELSMDSDIEGGTLHAGSSDTGMTRAEHQQGGTSRGKVE